MRQKSDGCLSASSAASRAAVACQQQAKTEQKIKKNYTTDAKSDRRFCQFIHRAKLLSNGRANRIDAVDVVDLSSWLPRRQIVAASTTPPSTFTHATICIKSPAPPRPVLPPLPISPLERDSHLSSSLEYSSPSSQERLGLQEPPGAIMPAEGDQPGAEETPQVPGDTDCVT
ncbi:hypothetical protein PCANC_11023 [Puccinia coronata f. sp. avenae]|uniref:Uncharacterized protein n=1 Tax=Puccinia coronata f. sp. avenae TaxID=200324 RepID=A0A2N5USX8_9BASI|nr:hypothetical protein PCANC_11023 [Puccinia coronata f. sp. avenae]